MPIMKDVTHTDSIQMASKLIVPLLHQRYEMMQKRAHTVDSCFFTGCGASGFRFSPAFVSNPNLPSASSSGEQHSSSEGCMYLRHTIVVEPLPSSVHTKQPRRCMLRQMISRAIQASMAIAHLWARMAAFLSSDMLSGMPNRAARAFFLASSSSAGSL